MNRKDKMLGMAVRFGKGSFYVREKNKKSQILCAP